MANNIDEDSVEYLIYIQAVEALKVLRELSTQATTFSQKMSLATASAKTFSNQFNMTTKDAAKVLGDLDKTFNTFGSDTTKVWSDVGKGGEVAGTKVESGMKRAISSINILRIALGAVVSMVLFQVVQAFGTMVREALKGIKEIEAATFNLINAEQKLSEQGIEIDTKGLDDLIVKLQKLDPMLSRFQATELVSTLATKVAPAFGLGTKEIDSLAQSITILAVRNQALGKSFEEVEQQVITGLLSGKVTAGINQLGLKITDQIVKEKAVELQLVETEKAYDALNAKEQERINVLTIMQILQEDTSREAKNLPKFFQSASGLIGTAQARLSDFLTSLGEKFAPLLKTIFTVVISILERLIKSLDENSEGWKAFISFITLGTRFVLLLAQAFIEVQLWIGKATNALVSFLSQFTLLGKLMKMFFPEKLFPDTPTNLNIDVETNADEAIQDLDKLEQKIEDIIEDTANAREDLAENLSRKLEDLDEEYRRKAEDAERDFLRGQSDINSDYERDVADLRRRHREEDQKDEAKYQLALWELRMRFLMDLDDALHARDARQVLRLQRQYALDKESLRRKHDLEGHERQQSQQAEVEDLTQRRDERLRENRLEYERKLSDQQIAKERERADLQQWYERELADIALAQERKMEALLKGWIDEKKITEANAAEVYGILLKYFGPGGLTDSLYAYMMNSLIASTQGAIAAAASTMTGMMGGGIGGGGHTQVLSSPTTTGGNDVAGGHGNSPKSSLLPTPRGSIGSPVSITPLSSLATAESGNFSGNGSSSMSGQIQIAVDLSPDLEARVVEKSMNGVGEIITKVNRSKYQ